MFDSRTDYAQLELGGKPLLIMWGIYLLLMPKNNFQHHEWLSTVVRLV